MYKEITTRSAGFKALMVVIFSAFFFVQFQAAFIASTNNDFPGALHASIVTGNNTAPHFLQGNKVDNNTFAKFKLNKRYQSATQFALLPVSVAAPQYSAILIKEWFSPSFIPVSRTLYFKPLRGPPFFDRTLS